ncbi:MAG TPA: hypothetical protein PKW98_14280, partial [Candidatus Wallbacteria bacterium]|nr:hypothetical protein [Candidatus Wallbacteria bacterium]
MSFHLIYNKEVTDDMFNLQKGYDFYKVSPDEYVVPFTNYPKSAVGNNGMFDMTNPNIYKTIIGGAIGAKVLTSNKNLENRYQGGGTIPKAQEGTATNPKTGERFYLTNEKGRFTPFDKRAYKTILPAEYPNEPGALKRAALSFITGKPLLGGAYDEKAISLFSKSKDYGAEMWKYALGSNDPMISVEASKYKPSDSEDPDARYFAIKDI